MTRSSRRLRGAILAAAMVVTCSLASCGVDLADQSTRATPEATASTTTPSSTDRPSIPQTTTPTAGGTDPDQRDVDDEVFSGLGDPRIDVATYDVTLRADPGKDDIRGRVVITLTATTADPLPSFTLDLRGPKVIAAELDRAPAKVTVDDDQIEVVPATPLTPGKTSTLAISYAGQPKDTEFPRLGASVGWQHDSDDGWFTMSEPNGTASWVPVNDHPSDKARWSISLDTPDDTTGVANGRLVSSDKAKGRRLWVWRSAMPMASYLAFVAVGDYELVQRQGPDGIHLTFAFPPGLSAKKRAGFDQLDDILAFYRDTFGPYPFQDSGATVVTSTLGLALESQTRPLFGEDAVGDGVIWALPHEVGHQWFGDAVSPARWEDLWLSESFATYADWLWTAHDTGDDIREVMKEEQVPTVGEKAVTDPNAASTFDGAVYEGGARALHALRLEVGDATFFEILRTWFSENAGTSVTTEDFIAHAEKVSGRQLDGFFDAWLRSAKQPELPD